MLAGTTGARGVHVAARLSLIALIGIGTVSGLAACKSTNASHDRLAETEPEEAIPPPSTLFAEGTLRDPDAFWSRIRSGGGGALMSLPDTAAGVALSRACLDPRVAHLVAGSSPFHFAVGEAPDGGLAFAIAMKVHDLRAARSALAGWDAGGTRTVGGMAVLDPVTGAGAPSIVIALAPSGYLVLASSASDLATLGAYATRTLPAKQPSPSSLVVRAAAAALAQAGVKATNLGALATSALQGLLRRAAPPAFDPAVFVACVNPALVAHAALLGDLAGAEVAIDTGDGEIHAVATLTPKPGDNPARTRLLASRPADPSPLLDAPGAAMYALFASDTSAERASDVAAIAPCFEQATGRLLTREGAESLRTIMAGWAKGRGDWDTISAVTTLAANGLVFRAPVTDAAATSHALEELTDLVAHPPLADAVEQTFSVLPGVVQHAPLAPLGQVTLVTFAHAPPPAERSANATHVAPPIARPPLGLAWGLGEGEVDLAVGEAPLDLVGSLRNAPKLGSDVATAQAIRSFGTDASFVAVLKPFGCCVTGGPTSTPLTIGWGRRDDRGWARLEMGYGLVVQLVGR